MDDVCVVRISTVEYQQLVLQADGLKKLLDAVYDGATLSYNEEYISFDDRCLREILKVYDKCHYEATLERLRKEKEDE